jgi:ribosome-associated protein
MDEADGIRINARLTVPRSELVLKATRSGGPGGQHVNTSSTRIELVWDITESAVLDEAQRARLLEKLASRLDGEGRLRIVSQEERSQLRNREAALARFAATVRGGLVVPRPRKPTKPTKASKERRLDAKKRRGKLKQDRRTTDDD